MDEKKMTGEEAIQILLLQCMSAIKKENEKCQFGISPFGVWRNIDKRP